MIISCIQYGAANVAVYDKRNQNIVYTNPLNADEDSIANETNKRYLKSQFVLNYFNKSRAAGIFDSYSMSVEKGQIRAESIKNGIRYIYDVGEHETSTTGIVPIYFSPEKMEEVQSKLSEADATAIRRYYINSTEFPGLLELNGVARKNKKTIQKIQGFLEGIGFTEDEYHEQMELAGVEKPESVYFIVPLEYRLEDDGVIVSVPTSKIEEYGEAKIYRIQLLRYMGAGGQDEKGYIVVPNGSGSIINFNNGKINAASIHNMFMVWILWQTDGPRRNILKARLKPCSEYAGRTRQFLQRLRGETLAAITTGISGKYSSYNYAYTSFMLRIYDVLSIFRKLGSSADLPIVVDNLYECNLSVKYTFLTKRIFRALAEWLITIDSIYSMKVYLH